ALTDFGESLVRLRYTPAKARATAQLAAVDWWTPWTDVARAGVAGAEGPPLPTNFRRIQQLARRGVLPMGVVHEDWSDMDLGSGGVVYVPSLDMLAGAGKDGVLYAAKAANLGKTQPADLAPGQNQANYAKLAFRPIFFTYFPPGLDPAADRIE